MQSKIYAINWESNIYTHFINESQADMDKSYKIWIEKYSLFKKKKTLKKLQCVAFYIKHE